MNGLTLMKLKTILIEFAMNKICNSRIYSYHNNLEVLYLDKKSISVPEMRRILGLGKTESYWLIKKGYFKTIMLFGKIRVMTDSFEEWYANQFHYKKTDGTPPGQNWRHTMSIRETADILGIAPTTVYSLIGKDLFNLLKMTSHMLDSQEDVKKELCKIIRSETKEKFQKMTETIKEYTEDKKVKEKIQASADYIMNNWSAAKKRLWKMAIYRTWSRGFVTGKAKRVQTSGLSLITMYPWEL